MQYREALRPAQRRSDGSAKSWREMHPTPMNSSRRPARDAGAPPTLREVRDELTPSAPQLAPGRRGFVGAGLPE